VDGRRLVISGESAGGFTALCAVASEELFAVGTSRFGIADLETFRQQAPKFQAHELDRLVGPYPEAAATYRARSPLHTVDRIARPVLLVRDGAPTGADAAAAMAGPQVRIRLHLGGPGPWACVRTADLTPEYVRLNSEYTT
jgi:hypothetical protein